MTHASSPSSPWLYTVLAAAATVALGTFVALRHKAEPTALPPALARVTVAAVQPATYEEKILLPARLQADAEIPLAAETGGRLLRWVAAEGALVKQGDIVAEMEKDPLLAREKALVAGLAAQDAAVLAAERDLENARLAATNAAKQQEALELEVKTAQIRKSVALKDFKRMEELRKQESVAQAALDQADSARQQAESGAGQATLALDQAVNGIKSAAATVVAAEQRLEASRQQRNATAAQLEELRIQVRKAVVCAPAAGRLDRRLAQEGEFVAPGREIIRLYKTDFVRAVVHVPDRQAPFLDQSSEALDAYITRQAPGGKRMLAARIIVPGLPRLTGGSGEGLSFPAEVVRLAAAADPLSNTFALELRVPNPGGALRHGYLAQAEIAYLSFPGAVVIPVSAVQVTERGPRVFVAKTSGAGEVAEARDIGVGGIDGNALRVTSGLAAGDRLVASGHRGLVEGRGLAIIREDGKPAGEAVPAGR